VYVTFRVSPDTTVRSPGDWKSASENNTPEVPLDTVHKNAPATTPPELLIVNDAGEAELEITEGLAVVAVPNTPALREPE
jgi:hypothetical protein